MNCAVVGFDPCDGFVGLVGLYGFFDGVVLILSDDVLFVLAFGLRS